MACDIMEKEAINLNDAENPMHPYYPLHKNMDNEVYTKVGSTVVHNYPPTLMNNVLQ